MADTPKRIGPTALGTSAATVYTVPSGKYAHLRDIHVCNETSSAAKFTMSVGTDGSNKRVYYNASVAPGKPFQRTGNFILGAGEVLQAYSDTNNALTLTISGVEQDA